MFQLTGDNAPWFTIESYERIDYDDKCECRSKSDYSISEFKSGPIYEEVFIETIA